MSRTFWVGTAIALMAAVPASTDAGVMLWQVTGMEGAGDCYAAATRTWRALATEDKKDEAVWRMPGVYCTAQAVMQWDIWHYLKSWLVATGRAADEKSARPTYRDLTASGYISIGAVEMPEMVGNVER